MTTGPVCSICAGWKGIARQATFLAEGQSRRYGKPKAETLARIEQAKAEAKRCADSGHVNDLLRAERAATNSKITRGLE